MADRPPLVGLTVNWLRTAPPGDAVYGGWAYRLNSNYADLVASCGAVPAALLPSERGFPLGMERDLDLVIMTGGGDPHPSLYGRQPEGCREPELDRPEWDLRVYRGCLEAGIPVLGICLGMQLIGIASGSPLIQDLPHPEGMRSLHDGTPGNPSSHTVETSSGSLISSLLGSGCIVSSFHHQALAEVPPGFDATARAPDGVLEAMESRHHPVVAVQWHPERDGTGRPLLQAMLGRTGSRRWS